jgi:Winged helix DNA-binding domain
MPRAWWMHRQGLTPTSAPKTIEECVRRAGWLPTFTGIYLSIRARMPGVSRDAIDRAAMDRVSLIEVPGAHGRPAVLVPQDEMALALRLHSATFQKHLAPHFAKGDLSQAALRGVETQICRVLDEGPLATSDIRASLRNPDAEELLVTALIDLSVRGIIQRFPVDGRLDSAKYMYELRHPDDRPDLGGEGDDATVAAKAVDYFLDRHGPATVDEISWWSGLTKTAVRDALGTLGASSVTMPGWAKDAWLLARDVGSWDSFQPETNDRVTLLPYRDPFVHMRRRPAVLARKPTFPVLDVMLRRTRIGEVDTLYHHVILSGADAVGVWEYDPDAEEVVTRLWDADAKLRRRVADAAVAAADFIRQQLGDAKLSAVDPPAKRAKRIAFCRAK